MTVIRPIIQNTNKEELGKIFRQFSFLLTQKTDGMEKEQHLLFNKLVRIDPPVMMCPCMLVEDGILEKDDGDMIEQYEMKGENLPPDVADMVKVLVPDLVEYVILEDDMICPVCEERVKDHDFRISLPVGVSSKLRVLDISNLDTIIRECYKKVGIEHLFMYKF